MRNIILPIFAGAFVIVGLGCGSDANQKGQGQDPSGIVFTETMVTINADGTIATITRPITLEEELAEQQARKAALAAASATTSGIGTSKEAVTSWRTGTSCQSSDMTLFDGTSGTGNKLCLYQSGTTLGYAQLYNLCRVSGGGHGGCFSHWAEFNNQTGNYDSFIASWYGNSNAGALFTGSGTGTSYTCALNYTDNPGHYCTSTALSFSDDTSTDWVAAQHWYQVQICNNGNKDPYSFSC